MQHRLGMPQLVAPRACGKAYQAQHLLLIITTCWTPVDESLLSNGGMLERHNLTT